MSALLTRLIDEQALPSPPGVALEIIRLNQQEEVDIAELSATVARDPAIAAKLLRTANSPGMGRPGQVSDLEDAVMVLGTRSVNLLALSFSLTGISAGSGSPSFDYTRFWTTSAVTTTAARLLAEKHSRAQRDEAFLAGLLCDFGQLMLAEAAPDQYEPVLKHQALTSHPIHLCERELLDCDHAELGSQILAHWGLPEVICEAIAAHHAPQRVDGKWGPARRLAQVLHLASSCSSLYVMGEMQAADEVVALGSSYFGMSAGDCQEFLDELRERVQEALDILDLEMIDAGELSRIRSQANEFLVRESLALDQRVQQISGTLEKLAHENSELEKRATTDSLTGLHNRLYLEEHLAEQLKLAVQSGGSVGLLIIDIDQFKSVNDKYGHPAGDALLVEVANLIRSHLSEDQTATRIGGDEFVVVCPDVSANALLQRAQLIRAAVDQFAIAWNGVKLGATLSIGGCVVEGVNAKGPAAALIESADAELYRAKDKGRNRVFVTTLTPGWY